MRQVKEDTPADVNRSIKAGDRILRMNGKDVSALGPADVAREIVRETSGPC